MAFALVLALTAIDPGASPAAAGSAPIHNYVRGAAPRERCGEPNASGEIVVCAKADVDAQYRLSTTLQERDAALLPQARVQVGRSSLKLHGDSVTTPQGAISNRAMVTLATPF